MFSFRQKRFTAFAALMAMAVVNMFVPPARVMAADHAESTSVATDPGADIGDVFAFLDPTNNSNVILATTVEGFIVPAEGLNLGYFNPDILFRFEIENTGDAIPDQFIDVTFSPQTSRTVAQTAIISFRPRPRGAARPPRFIAPTTLPTLAAAANPFVVTTDPTSGVKFYAGLTDDPFYFDIPAFSRFVASVAAGTPDVTRLQRSRDSFAGYNCHTVALSVPAGLLRGPAGNVIGVNGLTMRQRTSTRLNDGSVLNEDDYVQVDRGATPAVNTALIPFPRKNEFNASTPADDAAGRFAGSIVATLTSLGTNATNIGILASVAVTNGDYLRLNLATPNTSLGFGERATTPGYTGFPNGRRTGDDTIDVLLYFITNQGLLTGDNVNSNEVPLVATFPFFGRPNQPLENPAVDGTRN